MFDVFVSCVIAGSRFAFSNYFHLYLGKTIFPSTPHYLVYRYGGRESCPWRADRIEEHAFFDGVSWLNLLDGTAVAPFIPDPGRVYASDLDDIASFSKISLKVVTTPKTTASVYNF